MRMLLASHNSELEGAPKQLVRMGRVLTERGHSVCICAREDGALLTHAAENGVATDIAPGLYHPDHCEAEIARLFTMHRPAVFTVNTILGGPLVHAAKRVDPNVSVVWKIHESEGEHQMIANPYIAPDTFAASDAVVFVARRSMEAYGRFNTGNFHLIHNGLDLPSMREAAATLDRATVRKQYHIPQDATVLLNIGTVSPRKGHQELVIGFVRALEKLGERPNLHLVIVGKTWDTYQVYRDRVLKIAHQYGVAHRVHIFPETASIYEAYMLGDIFICNSFVESLPSIVFEAMAFGIPVIAGGVYGVTEQIEHENNGLLILPGHTEMLADAIARLIREPALVERLVENGKAFLTNYFETERMSLEYESLFMRLRQAVPVL